MGDVAQILKDTKRTGPAPSKAMKMAGVSNDVVHMLAGTKEVQSADLPPMVPAHGKQPLPAPTDSSKEIKVKVGTKWISSGKPARQWAWAPFASSSRTDGAMFRHWVRANVEYTDYPYAKFDIHLDPVTYTEEEAHLYLKSKTWTKSETDKLMELARRYELRWPVIHDRWLDYYYSQEDGEASASRKVEDLQERYYSVAAILSQLRIRQEAKAEAMTLTSMTENPAEPPERVDQLLLETAAARSLASGDPKAQPLIADIGSGTTNKMFDPTHERKRRAHLDRLWRRSKDDENEELELRKELKEVEAQLRKLKKSGAHILAASAPGGPLASAASSRNPSRSVSPVPGGASMIENPEIVNQLFASTAPVPMPHNPYLQSGRLVPPAAGGGVNKTLLTRMQQFLTELKVPDRPLPTKKVCDLYDDVRKDTMMLITLQKAILQREGTLQAKRTKLAKLGGHAEVLGEEALLGIPPPAEPVTPAPAPAKKTTSSTQPKTSKSKPKSTTATATGKSQTGGDSASKADEGTDTKKPKSAPKRKRKSDAAPKDGKDTTKKTTTPASAAATTPPKTTLPQPSSTIPQPTTAIASSTAAPTPATAPTNKSAPEQETGGAKKRARKS
eukprot:Nitzschia sp. Nitz4//scaffold221_size33835//20656//22503//NITZ4_007853-RA/size33835-processed-gene-0.14-mRNA-1//1//CDS//3329542563//9055//frame0